MNDQILMDNYLLLLKSTVEVYVHGTLESSNEEVRKLLKNSLDKIMESQANTYLEMADRAFYEIENIKEKDISKVLNKINNN